MANGEKVNTPVFFKGNFFYLIGKRAARVFAELRSVERKAIASDK